jgi:hypothetical protein
VTRFAALLTATTLVVAVGAPTAADGSDEPAAGDAACQGVWLVVDADDLGEGPSVRCAEVDGQTTGLAALDAAGHSVGFVRNQPGMVCTIDGLPDPCNGAPAHAYWAYWWSDGGDTWTYSTEGAGTRIVVPHGAEAWRFGDGSEPPELAPSELAAHVARSDASVAGGAGGAPSAPAPGDGFATGPTIALLLVAAIAGATTVVARRRPRSA